MNEELFRVLCVASTFVLFLVGIFALCYVYIHNNPAIEPYPPHYEEFIDSCTAEGNPLYMCIDMWREHEH